uniref:KIB1-4 beta-propeller domain-containing protein n=1 Tax=Oryza barthii TaxID=65489 RepID=A0A0D3HP33_9ORYZ
MADELALAPPPPMAGEQDIPVAVAHLALPDGKLFTFPETAPVPHVHGGGEDSTGYVAACDGWLLFDDDEFDVLRLTSPLTGKTRLLPALSEDTVRIRDNAIEVVGAPWRDGDGDAATQSDAGAEDMSVRKLVMSPYDAGLVAAVVGREHFAKVALCTMEGFSWSLSARDRWRTHYLVASRAGPLLMVSRVMPDAGTTRGFAVFVPDMASRRWVEVSRLDAGGEALYVGRLSSRAVPSLDDADKIFFLDDTDGMSFRTERQPRPPYHAAVYDMAGGKVSELLPRQPLVDGKTPVRWLFPDDDDDA